VDLFNCSVPNYAQFDDVFRCNYLVECYNGEDEEGCAYKTAQCGEDYVDPGPGSSK
jgi:hypothetical protein